MKSLSFPVHSQVLRSPGRLVRLHLFVRQRGHDPNGEKPSPSQRPLYSCGSWMLLTCRGYHQAPRHHLSLQRLPRPVLPAFFIAVNRFQRADRHPPNTLWNGVQVYWALLIVYCRRGNGDEQEERLKARFRFSAPIISMQPRRGCRRSKPLRRQLRLCPKGSHPLPRQPGFSPIQAGRRRKARCRLSEMRKATVPTPSWTRTSSRSLDRSFPRQ